MFFCLGKSDNIYTIVDTEDGVEEKFREDELKRILEIGVEVYGVTLESLSIDSLTTVLVDFPSREARTGQVFNGYFFSDYVGEDYDYYHNTYMYSLFLCDDLEDITKYIQLANSDIYSTLIKNFSESTMGYEVVDLLDNGMLNVSDVITGEVYGFSYSDVCMSIYEDKLSVRGLSEITKDYVTICSNKYYLSSSIDYITKRISVESPYWGNSVCCDEGCVDNIFVTMSGLPYFMNEYGDKKLSKMEFPMVSLLDYCKSSPLESGSRLLYKDSKYIGIQDDMFVFEDFSLGMDKAFSLRKFIGADNQKFIDDVERYRKTYLAKEKFLKGNDFNTKELLEFRYNFDYSAKKYEDVTPKITRNTKYSSVITRFGRLATATYIRDEDFSGINSIEGISLYSVRNGGRHYYRIGRSGITILLDKANYSLEPKDIEFSFTNYLYQFREELGYYCNRPNIMPLFVHSIEESYGGLRIDIVVAVNTNSFMSFVPFLEEREKTPLDKKKGWGMLFLVVPLILTGTRHYMDGDYVHFDMLLQELVMERSVYNNLSAYVDESNDLICIDNCSVTSSAKYCNCAIGKTDSKNVNLFKRSAKSYMGNFNKGVLEKSFF